MIKIDEKDIKHARVLMCRNTLLKLKEQCDLFMYKRDIYMIDFHKWFMIKKDLDYLLNYYDNGGEINEEFCLSLYDIKIVDNTIIVRRLIKLIKIHP